MNHIFGKCIQNQAKQLTCIFCRTEEDGARMQQRFNLEHMIPFGEGDGAILFGRKKRVKITTPYCAGFVCLELAKLKMYELFYSTIKTRHPMAYVIFTDTGQLVVVVVVAVFPVLMIRIFTDSLMLTVPNVTKNEFLKSIEHEMDFSNCGPDHPLYSTERKMIPGCLKDDTCGKQVTEVVALKSKCYVFATEDGKESSKCKGVKRSIIKRDLHLDLYKMCLTHACKLRVSSSRLQCRNYRMFLLRTRKVALSSYESKRYVMPCGKCTVPYFSAYLSTGATRCPKCGTTVEEMKQNLVRYVPSQ